MLSVSNGAKCALGLGRRGLRLARGRESGARTRALARARARHRLDGREGNGELFAVVLNAAARGRRARAIVVVAAEPEPHRRVRVQAALPAGEP